MLSLAWPGLLCAENLHRVGAGDDRTGYASPEYQTRSERLQLDAGKQQTDYAVPLGLPPANTELNPERVALGRALFFDRRLSANDTLSCAMCHIPEQGFAQNELATPVGIEGRSVRRNAPSLYNVAYVEALFHDGRERSLEEQIWEPLLANNEMGNASRAELIAKLAAIDDYAQQFPALYEDGLSERSLGAALAAYQRTLLAGGSPFDRWYFGRIEDAVSDAAKRGFGVFRSSGCEHCHSLGNRPDSTLFTNGAFYNTGIGYRRANLAPPAQVQIAPGVFVPLRTELEYEQIIDNGRAEVSGETADRWRYRVPTLRNVAVTAPYMHDGSLPTLASVIEHYNDGGEPRDSNQDPRLQPLNLGAHQQQDLLAFLTALTGTNLDQLAGDARSVAIGERQ